MRFGYGFAVLVGLCGCIQGASFVPSDPGIDPGVTETVNDDVTADARSDPGVVESTTEDVSTDRAVFAEDLGPADVATDPRADLDAADGIVGDEAADASDDSAAVDADTPDIPEVTDALDARETEVPPGTLWHFGWFGPGGLMDGNGVSGFGLLSGLQQAWKVK